MNPLPYLSCTIYVNLYPEKRKIELKWGVLFIYENDNKAIASVVPLRGGYIKDDPALSYQICIVDAMGETYYLSFKYCALKDEWAEALTHSFNRHLENVYDMNGSTLGASGTTFLGAHMISGFHVAIKTVENHSNAKSLNKLKMMRPLDHPNILRLLDVFVDLRTIYIVFPLMDGNLQDIFDKYDRPNEKQAWNTMKHLLSGLVYLRSQGIIHGDLKPTHILFNNEKGKGLILKICDFSGAQKCTEGTQNEGLNGLKYTREYAAPEICRIYPKQVFDFSADVFSLGVILFEMLTGKKAFSRFSIRALQGKFEQPEEYHNLSTGTKDIIEQMLEADPKKRVNAYDILVRVTTDLESLTTSPREIKN